MSDVEVLARVDTGERSVRLERVVLSGARGRPRTVVSIAVYEALHRGGYVCRRRVSLRPNEVPALLGGLLIINASAT